jgi:carbon monoxide dehydrogenase subunit G
MAIRFGGDFSVARSRQEVFDFLTDPNRFAPLLPEFQSLAVEDAQNFTVKVNVGVSYIRGTADVKMKLAEAARPERARYEGTGNVAGGSVKMTAGFDLEEAQPGTRVRWSGEAQIYGRLASMAGGMLEPLARKNVQKLIDGLESALGKG